ncbi:MAG: thioredoxin family protein [Bacteroidaceae bacterium]|nr:thioredoxin family protein [Bacteroidaceae bacterium]
MKHIYLTLFALFFFLPYTLSAQIAKPVEVSTQLKDKGNGKAQIVFNASIKKGWHVYSTEVVEFGPTPTSIHIEELDGAKTDGALFPERKPIRKFEKMFDADVFYFTDKVAFLQNLIITDSKQYKVSGYLEYGACNDESCIPPTKVEFNLTGRINTTDHDTTKSDINDSQSSQNETAAEGNDTGTKPATDSVELTDSANVTDKIISKTETESISEGFSRFNDNNNTSTNTSPLIGTDWAHIFILSFLGGLLALLTPCVWPIIPLTVSFFLKRSSDRRRGILDAVIYGVSIVVIYLLLGLIVTAVNGASALNALSTNAVFNIFFFLLLVTFALSFFGLFELKLPASWSTHIDNKAESAGGLFGIFLMAFTLTLVSFSCTGPIIGFLLVEVSTLGSIMAPAIGMLGFALALALPFALFAMFPSWMKQIPKSGSWMNIVKVILGFIELFFSLKFLSVADLAYGWHLLDRDVFIAVWIILAIALGLYLIGTFRFPHEEKPKKIGWVRWVLGIISFLFAAWMVPGLWGNPLKQISAFTPPMSTQHWRLVHYEVKARTNDYDEGIEIAQRENKPIIIDFTGFGCVNCRKMEAAVWTDPDVARLLQKEYVLIQLYVDDKTSLSKPIEMTEGNKAQKLRTVGDRWSYLQSSKFGANAQPFYVLMDPNTETLLADPYGFNEDVNSYIVFLEQGLDTFRQKQTKSK